MTDALDPDPRVTPLLPLVWGLSGELERSEDFAAVAAEVRRVAEISHGTVNNMLNKLDADALAVLGAAEPVRLAQATEKTARTPLTRIAVISRLFEKLLVSRPEPG